MNKLTPEQRDEAIEDFRRGIALKNISAKYGVSMAYISQMAKKKGAVSRGRWKFCPHCGEKL